MHFTHLTGQKVAPQVQLFAPLESANGRWNLALETHLAQAQPLQMLALLK